MNRSTPFSMSLAMAGALAATAGACHDDSARKADRAAGTLVQTTDQLRTAQTRVDEGGSPDRAKVADHEDAVARAADEFAVRRQTRVAVLAAEHGVVATQPPLLQTLVDSLPLTDIGRSEVAEKLTIFAMRLDDSAHAIAALEAVPASQFAERDAAVSKAMTRLEDARRASWKAIGDAPRLDRTSSL